jgi:hypothetical protein
MNALKNKVITIGAGVLTIVAITLVASRHSSAADGGPTVTIAAPLPLPIAGAVDAKQSGPWNVGITGQPLTVSVNNSPAVSLAPGSVLTRTLDDPGRVAYQSKIQLKCFQSTDCGAFFVGPVPAGRRIVIQHISGVLAFSAAPASLTVFVNVQGGINTAFAEPVLKAAGTLYLTAFDQPVLVYLDQFQTAAVEVILQGAPAGGGFDQETQTIVLTGYELDCNAAPCSPIAQQ